MEISKFNLLDEMCYLLWLQSSWTKRAVDVDSPQPMSPWDQLEDPPDSTCAQVIHSRSEAFGNHWVSTTAMKECRGKDDELGMHGNHDCASQWS